MKIALSIIQIIICVLLAGTILLQSGKGGLGRGVTSGIMYHSKRGAERIVFIANFVFAALFFWFRLSVSSSNNWQVADCAAKKTAIRKRTLKKAYPDKTATAFTL